MLEQIGTVFVDAGLIWVGDPCYIMGDDASNRVTRWQEFCDRLQMTGQYDNQYCAPLGVGVGFAVSSGLGDGEYPVYIETKDMGDWGERVSKIIIDFGLEQDDE